MPDYEIYKNTLKIKEKQEEIILNAIKNYCELNQNMFGKISVKKVIKFIEKIEATKNEDN